MTTVVRFLILVLTAILPQGNQDATPKAVRDPLTMGQVLVWMDGGAETLKEDARAHNELGIALCKQQKFSECLAELREAERLDPDDAFRHTQLGTILWNTGKCSDAVHEFQRATKLDPSNSYTHIRLLTLLLQLGRNDDAQTECKTLQAVMHTKKTCAELAAIVRKDTEKAPKLCEQP